MVVASHERPRRLGILLDALAEQTLSRGRWELVVAHTYESEVAADILERHELARGGTLRHVSVDCSVASPSVQRNVGWRAACGRFVAFTDDDCRPRADWLERLLAAAHESPGAIVQGATRPDPRDHEALSAVHVRTLHVDPPGRYTQTCNILYSRAVLERAGGFDERAIVGEDIDLARRARAAGAPLVAEPAALVWHAAEALSFRQQVRANQKWQHLAYLVKRHPELRRSDCCLRIFWKREHFRGVLAMLGLAAAVRRPWLSLAVLPYVSVERGRFGRGPRARLRVLRHLPELWLVELAEVATFARGSLRYRTLLL